MAKDGQIVMNDKFYHKFVDIAGTVLTPENGLSLAERLEQTPTLKNGVFYVAEELCQGYKGEWRLVNCAEADEAFLCLTANGFIEIKQDRNDNEAVMEAFVDGRVFGLISSLLALGILWYIAGSRKGMDANLYSNAASVIESAFEKTTSYFLSGDGRKDITQDEFREIESLDMVVMEFTKNKYEM